jgi:LPXTG-motif cell wall-anchored protein
MEVESLSYWSATGTSGELPIYNAPNISVSDLSKTFDGVPITTNDALNSVTTASNGAVHVQLQEYSTKKENYGWNDIDQALKAGDYSNDASGEHYRVVVTTDATSSYAPGSYTQEFRINKRPTTISIASIDAVMSNGTLSGWNITAQVSGFVSGYTGGSVTLYDTTNGANTALASADVPASGKVTLFVDATAIADPSACVIKASYGGDAYYYSGSEKSFATLPTLPTISVPDLTKTYDGVAITAATARPQISTNAESGVTVRIQQQAGDSWQDVSSAENAGHYRVLAETQASAAYVAGSASREFDILKAPIATSDSGVSETSGGVVTGWTVTAKVAGLVSGHAAGTVTFYSTANGTDVQLGSPVSVSADGTASTTISADGVASGVYTIKAVYSGAANYAGSEGSLTASLSLRGISGTASYDKTVGDAAFKLDMTTGAPTSTDVWTYRVAEDSFANFTREDGSKAEATVTVSDDGQVSINHAGTALIEVTLSDTSGTYADQTVYVTVTVGKTSLVVEPYAYGEDPETPIVSATYGGLDGLTPALRYSYDGGTSWTTKAPVWESGFVGSLAAGSIDKTAGVGTLLVPVDQSEGTFSIGTDKHTGFFSRDYDVSYSNSSAIAVGKRALNVTLGNIKGTYGAAAPTFTWTYDQGAQPKGGGLASFDTELTVFQEDPALVIDASVTGSSDFRSLSVKRNADGSVASYQSAVYATGGSAANYEVTFTRGNLTVEPESLADAARILASADAIAFTYNGSAQAPAAFSVTDGGSELTENTDYTVYLPDSSTDAGDYAVTLTGMGNYTGTATVAYTIAPAPLSVITSGASKVYDGTALTKADGATLQGLVGDETATVIGTGSQVDVGSSSNGYRIVWDGTAKEGNYTVASESLGTLTVSRRTLTIETSSATKVYDGKPLTAPGTVRGLADGDTVTFATTGSQTDPGSSKNSYTLDWDATAKFTNYDVWENLGTLTVTQTPDQIVVTTTGGTFEYDGRPHGASVTVSQLPAGLTVVEAESSAVATHVSDGEVKATADKLKIVNELGEDVTDKLNITYVDGTISIVPRQLFVSTKGGTKLYDGTPLAAIKGAKLEGLVEGETATLIATGSQTDAGSSPNTYQIQWGTAHADDYQVSESLGTLTVTASGNSGSAVKDSQPTSTVASNGSSAARSAAQAGGTPNTGDNTAVTAIAGVAVAGAALIALALLLRLKKSKR